MTILANRGSVLFPLGIACLIGSANVHAQSDEDARKRSFADLLARRAKPTHGESGRETAGAHRTANRTTQTPSDARSTEARSQLAPSTSPLVASVAPLAANATGVPSATPVAPSGYGPGRDAFVESLYTQILGRNALQSEVDYWSSVLARGATTNRVANLIWNSREHRTLVRNHEAPGIPLRIAYRNAIAYGKAHQQ
jgi:hypothetical protein